MENLPPYVVVNNPEDKKAGILRIPAQRVNFPLSQEDKHDIETLIAKYDSEERSGLGLAAPQIGISKQIAFVNVPDDPKIKKWRPNLTDTVERMVLINPEYEPLGDEKDIAYEACYSVGKVTGPVPRYTAVRYVAYDSDGNLFEGTAHGFLARVLQHEIDHLKGILCIDYVNEEDLISIEDYIKMRQKAIESAASA